MNDFEESDDEFRERAWAAIAAADESLARPRPVDPQSGLYLAELAELMTDYEHKAEVPEQHEPGEPADMTRDEITVRFAKEGLDRDRAIRAALADFQATVIPAVNEALKVLVGELRDDYRKQVETLRTEFSRREAALTARVAKLETIAPNTLETMRDVQADLKEHFAQTRREFDALKRGLAGQDDADPPRLPAPRLS